MRALAGTFAMSPAGRRIAFIVVGAGWALAMALPAAVTHLSFQPLLLALPTGGGATTLTIALAAIGRSVLAPRLVLMVL